MSDEKQIEVADEKQRLYGDLPEIKTVDGLPVRGYPIEIKRPRKVCVLRLPTTNELLTYLSAQKSIYRDLGRRQGQAEDVPNPKADRTLFTALRLDFNGEEFDDAEAAYALGLITRHKVTDCTRDGEDYIITISTIFAETVHRLAIPYQKDLADYFRHMYKSKDIGRGAEERRFPPQAPVELYDKIVLDATGYSLNGFKTDKPTEFVPPHHKRTAILELVSVLDALDPDLSPNS